MNYYLARGDHRLGPFSLEQLAGQGVRADSLVWAEGMNDWVRADSVPELAGLVLASAAMPPPVPPNSYGPPTHGAPTYGSPPWYGPPVGYMQPNYYGDAEGKKIAAGICGILFGWLGVHKFILGYNSAGVTTLLVSILGACVFGIGPAVMSIIGIVEGIIYLTKSTPEFHQTYIVQKKQWF